MSDPWPIERMKELYGPRVEPPGPLSISARERREPKPMRRTKAVKKRNPERLARRREVQFSDCARMARLQPCCICGRLGPSDASHVLSRGAGGKDTGNVVPMCRKHHGLMSAPGWGAKRVEEHYGVSLDVIASYVLDSVRAHCCTEWPMCDPKTGATVCRVCLEPLPEEPTP